MGSSVAIDTLALHDRKDPMAFEAAKKAAHAAGMQAGIMPIYADIFELDDSFSIYAALTLEACGFADKGTAWQMARDGLACPDRKAAGTHHGRLQGARQSIGSQGRLPGSGSHAATARTGWQESGYRRTHRPHPGIGRSGIYRHCACAGERTIILLYPGRKFASSLRVVFYAPNTPLINCLPRLPRRQITAWREHWRCRAACRRRYCR